MLKNMIWFKQGRKDCYTPEVKDLVGIVPTKVYADDETLTFETPVGLFRFYHLQDCCESVYIESIVGDLQDLVGEPITFAEEVSDRVEVGGYFSTWTFYKFATIKGYVDVRWHGNSNGFYSESVDFEFIAFPDIDVEKVFNIKEE